MSITLSLAWIEGRNLLHLVDEFLALVDAPATDDDPALARLTPIVYPDDDAAAAEFREGTRLDLLDRRRADALAMRSDLVAFDVEDEAGRDVLAPHALVVGTARMDSWMRTLAAIRLVVASRLGVDHHDRHDVDDPRFHVYDWLGYRLDDLIRLADEHDGVETSAS